MENLIALLAAALALMATPGPVTLASAAAGAAWPGRALPYVLGMSTGTITVILMVAAGVTGIIASIPGARPVIAGLAAAYILYLAWRIATAPPIGSLGRATPPPPFAGGYAMGIANPKAWGAFAALFSGFPLIEDDPVAGGAAKAALLCCLPPLINIGWMTAGASLARIIREPRAGRALNIGFAVVLVASTAAAVL